MFPYPYSGAKGERNYKTYSFLTSSLDGVICPDHAPLCTLPPGKNSWYQLNRRLGAPQS
jgi:hypothetical protein